VKIAGKRELDFPAALRWLGTKWGVKRLLCEGGGELNAAMFQADLVDEIHLTICPMIFGGRNAPTIAEGQGLTRLAQAKQFKLKALRHSKGELFTVFTKPISG
jgi:riboflavin biosynthesis pyrimidine reductase